MQNTLLSTCPVCQHELQVTRLECRHCGTEIGGQFDIGRLHRLAATEIEFLTTFVKNRGNAYRVADELQIPYSAVRARLTEVIRMLGFDAENELKEETGISVERRKQILDEVSEGKLSSSKAIKLLQGEES